MKFFSHIKNVIDFSRLPKSCRRLTFYSESRNYWTHLEGLVKEVLDSSDVIVTYVSSDENDPGLSFNHPNYLTFLIDEGFVRNWFFENIETDVMVMSMPDINQFQVKRSKNNVHYVYVQHSLVSLHMVYREGAFDFYDTIFCAGPYHLAEMRAIEVLRNLPKKVLVEHGYSRLDSILVEAKKRVKEEKKSASLHALIAPSWGADGTIETGIGIKLVTELLHQGCRVTLRPHPQTIKFNRQEVDAIVHKFSGNPLFFYENNVAGQNSLHDSDFMISDWSGAALDYAFGLNKPVMFVDVPRKVNNTNYQQVDIEPFEVGVRSKIGTIVDVDNLNLAQLKSTLDLDFSTMVYNIGKSDQVGARHLLDLCGEGK